MFTRHKDIKPPSRGARFSGALKTLDDCIEYTNNDSRARVVVYHDGRLVLFLSDKRHAADYNHIENIRDAEIRDLGRYMWQQWGRAIEGGRVKKRVCPRCGAPLE